MVSVEFFGRRFYRECGRFHRDGYIRHNFVGVGQPRERELGGGDVWVGNVCRPANGMPLIPRRFPLSSFSAPGVGMRN